MSFGYQILYFSTGWLIFAISFLLFINRPTDRTVRYFALMSAMILGWLVTLFFFYVTIDHVTLILVGRYNFAFSTLAIMVSYPLVLSFPGRVRWFGRRTYWTVIASGVALSIVTVASDLVDRNELFAGIDRITDFGPLYPAYAGYLLAVIALSTTAFVFKVRATAGADRRALVCLAVGWCGATVWACFTQVLIPFLTRNYWTQHLGSIGVLFLVAMTSFAVIRYRLLNARILAAEFIMSFIVLLFVLNLSLAVSVVQLAAAAFALVASLGLGLALIWRVRVDDERREELLDVSHRLEASNRRLRNIDEIKTDFLSIASHQLRTPVAVIRGYLALIREGTYGPVSKALGEKLGQIRDMNDRLVHLINGLLNVSRIEKNRLEYDCRPTDVVGLIGKAVEEMTPRGTAAPVKPVFIRPARTLPEAYIDGEKVYEVLVNLLDNSLKFTPSGSIKVSAESRPETNAVIVRVADTGRGMNAEEQDRAFEKYHHIRRTGEKTAPVGIGIGLYICATFIRGMGGDIWIERTEPGKGTVIAVSLPIQPAAGCAEDGTRYSVPLAVDET